MKYKVGNKVKVREKLVPETNFGGVYFGINMREYEGKEAIVKKVGNIAYHLDIDEEAYWWTDEMLEPVEEMSAEEAIKLSGKMCSSSACYECPVFKSREKYGEMCNVFRKEHAEEYLEILKQWKADHEKKDVEVEFACIVRVIEDTGSRRRCVYEENVTGVKDETFKMSMKRILEKYCKEHEGKFFTVYEEICRVKE